MTYEVGDVLRVSRSRRDDRRPSGLATRNFTGRSLREQIISCVWDIFNISGTVGAISFLSLEALERFQVLD